MSTTAPYQISKSAYRDAKRKGLIFACVPVDGPPCLKCQHQRTKMVGDNFQCPKCGNVEHGD